MYQFVYACPSRHRGSLFPLRLGGFCVVVWLGSGPGLLLLCCFLRGETQIWLGDLRVVLVVFCCSRIVSLPPLLVIYCTAWTICVQYSVLVCLYYWQDRASEHYRPYPGKKHRRKFRSQTSDNMDRWKAEQGRGREKRKIRRKKSRRGRVRRKKMQMREKVGKSRNTVFFQWFRAPEIEK